MMSWLDVRARKNMFGLALSDTTLYTSAGERYTFDPRLSGDSVWPGLRDAFAELALRNRAGSRACAIALLPPITSLRIVELPKMRDADLNAVLGRSVQRYFPAVREAQAIAALRLEAVSETQHRYAIVAASSGMLFAIQSAASGAGFSVDTIVSAYSSWAQAGDARRSANRQGAENTVAIRRDDGGADVIRVRHGVPVELRRLRAGDVATDIPHNAVRIETPAQDAARYAPRVHVLELMTDEIRTRRAQVAKRKRLIAAAAAIVLIFAGMGAYALQQQREASSLAQAREALRPQVDSATKLQAKLAKLTIPGNTLARTEEHGVRWAAIITELSENLPPDSYIESMRAVNDSLAIDVASANGARAIQSLAASELLANVVPVGSIRRDVRQDAETVDDALERFTLSARARDSAPLIPKPVRGRESPAATGVFGSRPPAAGVRP